MRNIVFVGAWGTGISAIAMLMYDLWYSNLVCIDAVQSQVTDRLEGLWIKVIIWHWKYEVKPSDFVIYSDIQAIKDWPELAQSLGFQANQNPKQPHRPYTYNEFLGELSKHFKTISFAGSNGKSSSCGLSIYAAVKTMPLFGLGILGAFLPDFDNKNYVVNTHHKLEMKQIFDHILSAKAESGFDYDLLKKYFFFVEACEYKDHFLLYDNDWTIITNIDHDHTDYFETYDSYKKTFKTVIDRTRRGVIISQQAVTELELSMEEERNSKPTKILSPNWNTPSINFDKIFGEHHYWNAEQSISLFENIEDEFPWTVDNTVKVQDAYGGFSWLRRRMELLHDFGWESKLYSDYSHHGPAILRNLETLRKEYPSHKLIALFQPHQARRVIHGWDSFADSLRKFDETYIYKLYTAREKVEDFDFSGITDEDVTSFEQLGHLFSAHCDANYLHEMDQVEELLNSVWEKTIVVMFSAGDIDYGVRNFVSKGLKGNKG